MTSTVNLRRIEPRHARWRSCCLSRRARWSASAGATSPTSGGTSRTAARSPPARCRERTSSASRIRLTPQPSISWLFDLGSWSLWGGRRRGRRAARTARGRLHTTLVLLFAACRQRAGIAVNRGGDARLLRARAARSTSAYRVLRRHGRVRVPGRRTRASRLSVRPLLLAIPLVLVWSNLHVESIFGLAFLGCFWRRQAAERRRRGRARVAAARARRRVCGLRAGQSIRHRARALPDRERARPRGDPHRRAAAAVPAGTTDRTSSG